MSATTPFNYYEELEVSQAATKQEIVASYRRLAMVHHPDRNHGDADISTAKFQRVSACCPSPS
jgi:curved DNA-binding protein CbpA